MQTMIAVVPNEAARAAVTATVEKRFHPMGMRPVVGTVEELRDYFDGCRDKGVERFYCWFADFAPPSTLDLFAAITD